MKNEQALARWKIIGAMVIFGTIGVFKEYIPFPSGMIAMARGLIGFLFLIVLLAVKRQPISWRAIRNNLLLLLASGVLMGFNWILLFEAFNYTSVATATLCYYMAPIFVTLAAPLVLKERLTVGKVILSLVAFVGMILVSDVIHIGVSNVGELKGILLGLLAALLYAAVVLLNKKLRDISAYDRTIVQLAAASVALVPYVLLAENISGTVFSVPAVLLLLVVGILHTGVAYALYFGGMEHLPAQTVAIFSYIDPVLAVVLSAVVLQEGMSFLTLIGGGLILGATLIGEL